MKKQGGYKPVPASFKTRKGRVNGLPCPECNSHKTAVVDSRPGANITIRRRRCCLDCTWRFITYETTVDQAQINTSLLSDVGYLETQIQKLLKTFTRLQAQLLAAGGKASTGESPPPNPMADATAEAYPRRRARPRR